MTNTNPRIAYLGLGLMGSAMVRRLLDQEFSVTIWNRSPDKITPLLKEGARAAATPAAAVRDAEIIISCVYDAAAVESLVFVEHGVAEAASADKVLVDHSTIHPDQSVSMAQRLLEQTGMGWVDAPVSGGPEGARTGTMAIMAGGRVSDIDRIQIPMRALGRVFTHVGPPGAGQTCKCINQVIVGVGYVLMAEAVSLAERLGLDAANVPKALQGGHADSRMLQTMYPRMVERAFEPPSSHAQQMLKDLDAICAIARRHDLNLPVLQGATQRFRDYCDAGQGDAETASILKLYTNNE